jgi:predicted dehydrogenase
MSQLRIGVIGVSGRGGLATNWHQPNGRAVLVAGADISEDNLAEFKKKYDGAFVTTDYKKMLQRSDVDAVAVTSPDFCHEEHAVAALEAGKHVFCEKPLAITTAGCDRILRAWKKSGKKLMVGFNMRYMAHFRTMKEIVDSGVLGELKAVWVRHFVGEGSNFYFHDWHATRKNCTSLLLQKGSHDIDVIHWITGRYTERVSAFGGLDYFGGDMPNDLTCPNCDRKKTCPEVQDPNCRRQQCCFRKEVDVEDNMTVNMQLEGGIKAAYLQCHFTPDYHRNYVFIGTQGRMENSEPENKVWVKTRVSGTWRDFSDRVYELKKSIGGHGGGDPTICEEFLDVVLLDKEPLSPPLAGRMSVAVGCAGAESMRNGGVPLDIAPVNW